MQKKETYWSKFADDFEERNDYVVGKGDIDLMLSKLSEEKQLGYTLELGCGNGTYSKIISKNANQLVCTDLSDEMVAASKVRLKSFVNVKVEKANCCDLPYQDDSFDTVFMANLLHVVPNPVDAVVESKRVLKPKGKIIISSYTTDQMTFFNRLAMMYRYVRTYGRPSPYAKSLQLQEIDEMLKILNFEIVQSEMIGRKMKAIFITARNA
jgi:ubiquinone/menaquinone biosynthesis C-methylase UbiE